jgi:hypothetical protein
VEASQMISCSNLEKKSDVSETLSVAYHGDLCRSFIYIIEALSPKSLSCQVTRADMPDPIFETSAHICRFWKVRLSCAAEKFFHLNDSSGARVCVCVCVCVCFAQLFHGRLSPVSIHSYVLCLSYSHGIVRLGPF